MAIEKNVILHLWSKRRSNRPICCRDTDKIRCSIWRPSAILDLQNVDLFVKSPSSGWKSASAYQIWSKSDNSRLRYGDKAIFKMAAVRHFEFSKIANLVTWPISVCDSSSRFKFRINRPLWRQDIATKRFSIWRPSAILNFQNFDPFVKSSCLHAKFDRNRKIYGWDIEIKLFSKWRPSVILNFRKCHFGHVTHICVSFFISDPIFALIGQYGAEIQPKTNFNMASIRHLGFGTTSSYCMDAAEGEHADSWGRLK